MPRLSKRLIQSRKVSEAASLKRQDDLQKEKIREICELLKPMNDK